VRGLSFAVEGVGLEPFAAAPQLVFELRVGAQGGESIAALLLRAQVQIDAPARSYSDAERARLRDVFGEPALWGRSLRTMLWTHAQATAPPFEGSAVVGLPVACTFDFNGAATKYFHALEAGVVPLVFLFSGTVFHAREDGALRASQLPSTSEARFAMPVTAWRTLLEKHQPNSTALAVPREVFDRLDGYRMAKGIPTLEQALDRLLAQADAR
jgi:hypothetical protein